MVIYNKDGPHEPLEDLSLTSGAVTVYFRMIEENFVRHVAEADAVFGCMAWLTNASLLRALADVKEGVQIIVQKEDFLRPDQKDWHSVTGDNFKVSLRIAYDRLNVIPWRPDVPGTLAGLSCCEATPLHAVRCVGIHNKIKKIACPRMHNKFMVFCRVKHETLPLWENRGTYTTTEYVPYAVWTGSFNFSHNATKSFENVVVIEDAAIAQAYCEEWSQIAALSEPLDWDSDWVEPQWCIGT